MTDSEKLDLILSNMQTMNNEISYMKDEISYMKDDLSAVNQKVTAIELKLENEIDHNFKIIAEGHLDLSRKLNQSIKIASDIQAKQELQDLYISSHEFKLKAL